MLDIITNGCRDVDVAHDLIDAQITKADSRRASKADDTEALLLSHVHMPLTEPGGTVVFCPVAVLSDSRPGIRARGRGLQCLRSWQPYERIPSGRENDHI
jgi:hypothetical protein